jgi:L-lactate dehydrogenase complex protein LldG
MSLVETFTASATAAGFHVHHGRRPRIDGAAVSEAAFGLADTGSVVIRASPEEPRARHLLAEVHISMLRENCILPGLHELFATVGDALPSALTIVTGPSRSGDIEQRLVVGVHGPREVHVVLVP